MRRSKNNNQEYWYFRLREADIFDADVQQIKNVPAIGYIIFVIYIELCGRATRNGGSFRVDKTSPQNGYAADLARLINEDATHTGHALSYLISKGFVEVTEEVDAFVLTLPMVINNTGRSSLEADRVRAIDRKKREEEQNKLLLESNTDRLLDCKTYGVFNNIYLTDDEYVDLQNYVLKTTDVIDIISVSKDAGQAWYSDYETILKYAINHNRLSEIGKKELLLF